VLELVEVVELVDELAVELVDEVVVDDEDFDGPAVPKYTAAAATMRITTRTITMTFLAMALLGEERMVGFSFSIIYALSVAAPSTSRPRNGHTSL
jgi:hypothetical protein